MSLAIITRRSELLIYLTEQKEKGKTIGFVPTMGALHEGHASLVNISAQQNDYTILSIFVNPKQFGPNEDFSKYPRTFQDDIHLAEKSGATAVFLLLLRKCILKISLRKCQFQKLPIFYAVLIGLGTLME